MSSDDAATQYLDPQAFRRRLQELDDSALMRLYKKARIYTWKTGMDPEDLLHEAIARTLAGGRSCPEHVDTSTYLCNAMLSIASTARERRDREIEDSAADDESGDRAAVIAASAKAGDPTVRHAKAADSLKRLEAAFAGDTQAEAVIIGLANQWTPAEIQEVGEMDETQYHSARRRVRRTLERRFREENDDDA